MLGFVDSRRQLKIFVSPDAKKAVEEFAEAFDMKEQGVASRFYEWFGKQPLPVKKWIVGLTDGNEGAGLRMFAHQLTSSSGRGPTFDVTLLDEKGDPVDEEPEKSPVAGGRAGRARKP